MLSEEQNSCIQLVLKNIPEPIKSSPIMVDVADESMRHIMGGDPLESLRIKAIRAILANVAEGKYGSKKDWISLIENQNIEHFATSFLNQSPEIMISILEQGQWPVLDAPREAKFVFKHNQITLEINRKQYLNINHQESFKVPNWMPHLLRNLCNDQITSIAVNFEGQIEDTDTMLACKQQFFNLNKSYASSPSNSKPLAYKYDVFQGTLCFSAHSKRRAGNTVFMKYTRRASQIERDINEIVNIDFS